MNAMAARKDTRHTNENSCTYVGHIDENDLLTTIHMIGAVAMSPVMGGTRVSSVAVLAQASIEGASTCVGPQPRQPGSM